MSRFLKPLAGVILLSFAVVPGSARGQGPSPVIDEAGMFGKGAVEEAGAELAKVRRDFGVNVTIETVESLRGQGIDEFAIREAERHGHEGIFVLIAKKEHKVEALASPRRLREELGIPRLNAIRDAFIDPFREGRLDAGLAKGVHAAAEAVAAIKPARRAEATHEASPAGGSSAGTSPLVLRQQVRLSLAGAREAIAGAEAKAIEKGYKVNIAAVDDGGHLLAFARMDGARPASVATAQTKAVTAATYRQATGPLPVGKEPDVLLNLSLQNASGGKLTTLLGGVPIVVDGQVIGALGVGGGTGEQDAEVARAGVEAFTAGLRKGSQAADKDQGKEVALPKANEESSPPK